MVGALADSGATVAFEVDHYDSLGRTAWSVLISGSLTRATGEETAALTVRLSPWPGGGERDLTLRLGIARISGRAVKYESP